MDDTKKRDLLFFFPAFIAWLFALLIPSFWNLQAPIYTLKTPTDIAGTTLFIAGFLIRITAQATLKRNYSGTLRIRDGHTLITHGIYSHVRHPVYTGVILSALAIPLYTGSLPGLLMALLGIPLFNYRIANEEKMLIQEYGHQYTEYIKTTPKLIPRIY
jgi:protein-S-isoprenylcysteine O-methyltransferase Ste14